MSSITTFSLISDIFHEYPDYYKTMEELSLHLNTTKIAAGKELAGTAIFQTSSTIEAKFLVFQFTGKETSSFTNHSKSHKYSKKHFGKSKQVRIEITLHEWKSGFIDPGIQNFPFLFELPFDLASSFDFTTKNVSGSISYMLKAKVEDICRKVLFKTKVPVNIVQQIDPNEPPVTEFNTPLFSCNCINRGFCVTTIQLSKQRYSPGDYCNISITVDNSQAKVDINNLECILWMTCRLISNESQTFYFRKCIFFYQYQKAIKYKESLLGPKQIRLEIPIAHDKFDISRCSETYGKLVQCMYSFQISLEFGTIIAEEPDMRMPVHISLLEEPGKVFSDEKFIRLSRDMY